MQPYLVGFLLLLLFVALQGAWPSWLRIAEQPPGLVVAMVVCIGLARGATDGCLAGLVAAILHSGADHIPMGGLFVGLMAVGGCAGFLRGSLLSERLEVAVLVAAVAVVLSGALRMIFVPPPEFVVWLKALMASALYTALLAPLPFWLAKFTRTSEHISPTRGTLQ